MEAVDDEIDVDDVMDVDDEMDSDNEMDPDYEMDSDDEIDSDDEREERIVSLLSAKDVVRFAFLVHKSLDPLDLSTLEFSSLSPTTFTEEGFQKLNAVKERKLLFTYHLDVSHGLEKALKETEPGPFGTYDSDFKTNIYRVVEPPINPNVDNFYLKCLYPFVLTSIKNSRNKTVALRKFLPLLKILYSSLTIQNRTLPIFARILQEECTDSELVRDFVEEVVGKERFCDWLQVYYRTTEEFVEYFLHHMEKMNIELQVENNSERNLCLSKSLLDGKYRFTMALIKYGKIKQPVNDEDIQNHVELFSVVCGGGTYAAMNWIKCNGRLVRDVYEETKIYADHLTPVRKWLFLLLVGVYRNHKQYEMYGDKMVESSDLGIKALQMMWRAISEPYLTLNDLQLVWREDHQLQVTAGEVYSWYQKEIMDAKYQVSDDVEPRMLQHLTRCEIRRQLAHNRALPEGLQRLRLPRKLCEFLSLER